MDNTANQKSIVYIVLIVVLLVVGLGVIYVKYPGLLHKNTGPRFAAQNIKSGSYPDGIPVDVPQENSATVLTNQEITDSLTDLSQSVHTYTTTKTITDNFAAYEQYITAKKWHVLSVSDFPLSKKIVADTGEGTLTVTMSYASTTPPGTISLYYSHDPVPTK